jgi:hypothetical protein
MAVKVEVVVEEQGGRPFPKSGLGSVLYFADIRATRRCVISRDDRILPSDTLIRLHDFVAPR